MAILQKDNRQVNAKNEADVERYKAMGYSEVNEKGEYLAKPAKDDKKKITELEKENKELKAALEAANAKITELGKKIAG